MATNKTTETNSSVIDFVNSLENELQKADSHLLIKLFSTNTGFEPKLWGPSIIGFGSYHYKYASGHEGDAPLVAFSPRKAAISLYVFTGLDEHKYLLNKLGKFKVAKACIYLKKYTDLNEDALKLLLTETITYLKNKYP